MIDNRYFYVHIPHEGVYSNELFNSYRAQIIRVVRLPLKKKFRRLERYYLKICAIRFMFNRDIL